MALPIKTFWLMSGNVDRIVAREDLRAVSVAMVQHFDAGGIQGFRDQLTVEAGTVVKLDTTNGVKPYVEAKRDEDGFAALKNMGSLV